MVGLCTFFFLVGVATGGSLGFSIAALTLRNPRKPAAAAAPSEPKPVFNFGSFWKEKPKPEPRKMPTEAIKRATSWRVERRRLEREHNTQQQMRDRGPVGL